MIRFVTWEKFTGAVRLGNNSQGNFDPTGIKINFAVPNEKALKKENEALVTFARLLEPRLLSIIPCLSVWRIHHIKHNTPPLHGVSITVVRIGLLV